MSTSRNIPFGKPIIGEEEKKAVLDVLATPTLVHGPRAKEFEAAFAQWTGAKRAVSVSSCTAALHLCYFYLGLGKGDEVIVPAQTHVATAHAVEFTGAKPVFVDAEIATGNIDLNQIEEKITPNTKALSIVHYLGMPVDMDRLRTIAQKHHLFIVEDCALALGTYYKGVHAGLHGDAGCYSFYPVKHMTTAEGGMLITQKDKIADKIQYQKAFGVDRTAGDRKVPGVYDVTMLGFNYRLNEIQAAIGIEQLKRLKEFLRVRRENEQILRKGFEEMKEISLFKASGGDYQSSYYCFSILLEKALVSKRFDLVAALNTKGVGTSVYYPHPVPRLQYYREKYGYDGQKFPVASTISDSSIALPVGPHLNADDMKWIVQAMKESIVSL